MLGVCASGDKAGPWGRRGARTGSWKRKQEALLSVILGRREPWAPEVTSARGGALVLETDDREEGC